MGPIDEGNLLLSRHAAQKGNLDDSTNTIGKLQAANALVRECVLCSGGGIHSQGILPGSQGVVLSLFFNTKTKPNSCWSSSSVNTGC